MHDIDDETVTLLLSSERGKTCKNPGSLINDEEFRLKAREFVRCHAYKRGKPNLTADMFNAWMKETYKLEVCSETARVWLHNLGFSQKKHHKSVYFDGHTSGMNAEKMREIMEKFEDFNNEPTLVEEKVQARGHLCMFFPKFHCELNASERCWCNSKKHKGIRKWIDYTIKKDCTRRTGQL